MRGAFDDDYLEQRKSSGDTEFTLGAGTMLLIATGLVVVCGVCFGLGYIVGHSGATPQAAAQQIDSPRANPQASSSLKKGRDCAFATHCATDQPIAVSFKRAAALSRGARPDVVNWTAAGASSSARS
jgi:hypothetical protein